MKVKQIISSHYDMARYLPISWVANHTSAPGQSERPAASADQLEALAVEAGADSVWELAAVTLQCGQAPGPDI